MNKYERLDEIARRVNEKGTIRITDIVEDLNVSDMTVRRDLIELEEQGILTKIHGVPEVIKLLNIKRCLTVKNIPKKVKKS
ncbi:DeoR family transcriptional regulator [Staphylococcus pseudintermedius]